MSRRLLGWVVLTLAVLGFGAAPSVAQAPRLVLELNKVETFEEGCEFHILIQNNIGGDIVALGANLVFFDQAGVMSIRTIVPLGQVKSEKTVFRSFVLPDLKCGDVGRVLVNDLTQCQLGRDPQIDCLDVAEVSSRADIELFK